MASRAFVETVPYSSAGLDELLGRLAPPGEERARQAPYLLDYPTVYVIHRRDLNKYVVYVGETSDIRSRTKQHLNADSRVRDTWAQMSAAGDAEMYVVGHTKFNKSLSLDVENRLLLYLTGADDVDRLNARGNPQNDYYTRDDFEQVFSQIWRQLRKKNPALFPTEQVVRDSALFKASPFHKLSREQLEAKAEVLEIIQDALRNRQTGQLVLVKGAAGAGKTVLLSSLFYELFQSADPDEKSSARPWDSPEAGELTESQQTPADSFGFQPWNSYLLVNHDEQLTVYQEIARKLMLLRRDERRVSRPTTFINNHHPDDPVDVVLVDEAHLLWTQGKQSYRGTNMLDDLLARAKVVVAVFDQDQILLTNQYLEEAQIAAIEARATQIVELDQQMRIDSSEETLRWIRSVIDEGVITNIPPDNDYEIKIFDSPKKLHEAVRGRSSDIEKGLSRLLATFDWPYSSNSVPEHGIYWEVSIGDFKLPWNLERHRHTKRLNKRGLAWAEQPHTIDEVGSTFTIQGFDLNYAGVILGPSIIYRDGRVLINPEASANKGATRNRTLSDGKTKTKVGKELLRNELNVLLTRGVHGLYIYAVDDELREALLLAQKGQLHV